MGLFLLTEAEMRRELMMENKNKTNKTAAKE